VAHIAVELWVEFGLENIFENAKLGFLLGLEGVGILEDFTVAIAQDIGGKPAIQPNHARFESGREDGFEQGLTGLEVFAADGDVVLAR